MGWRNLSHAGLSPEIRVLWVTKQSKAQVWAQQGLVYRLVGDQDGLWAGFMPVVLDSVLRRVEGAQPGSCAPGTGLGSTQEESQ